MKTWTIGKRLASGFAVIVLIFLCFGIVNWLQMNRVTDALHVITGNNLPELQVANDIKYQAAILRVSNLKYVLYDATQKVQIEGQIGQEEAAMTDLLSKLDKSFTAPEKRAVFSKLPPLWEAYRAETVKLRQASTQNNADGVKTSLAAAGKIGTDFLAALADCQGLSGKETRANCDAIDAALASSRRVIVVIGFLVAALSGAISLFISNGVSRILRSFVTQLNIGAEQTSAAAGQVSAASQTLAEGASEQAASLEETSASLEELSSMTRHNADNAHKANELAKQARSAADKGAADMQTMSVAMEAIKVSSDDIAKIIKTIDEIAFQTNILALNAAVEAARAGEAGMGFAVVADEVRNLAQRSAQAAKETAAKIEGAITKTGQGVEISTKVGLALNEIVEKARQVDELVAEVAGASREQTQGITQINTAVGQMDKVTQANAATAEESAAASEELNAQAEVTKHSVGELLKLVGGGGSAATGESSVKANGARTRRPAPKVAANGNGHHRNGNRTTTVSAAPIKPAVARSEIPLEGDFKDF
jgi:methyl-accepting chemotaxis protein